VCVCACVHVRACVRVDVQGTWICHIYYPVSLACLTIHDTNCCNTTKLTLLVGIPVYVLFVPKYDSFKWQTDSFVRIYCVVSHWHPCCVCRSTCWRATTVRLSRCTRSRRWSGAGRCGKWVCATSGRRPPSMTSACRWCRWRTSSTYCPRSPRRTHVWLMSRGMFTCHQGAPAGQVAASSQRDQRCRTSNDIGGCLQVHTLDHGNWNSY